MFQGVESSVPLIEHGNDSAQATTTETQFVRSLD